MSRFITWLHHGCLHRDFLAHTTPLNLTEQILADWCVKVGSKGVSKGRKKKGCSGVMQLIICFFNSCFYRRVQDMSSH